MKNPRICNNSLCKVDYPHDHVRPEGGNPNWMPTIDDPAVSAKWPDRLQWQRPDRRRSFGQMFKFGWFVSHSGLQLPWKLDCDTFTDGDWEAIAQMIAWKFAFRSVYGIPRGGCKLAKACDQFVSAGYPILIVDDVLTTGRSFIEARAKLGNPENCIGVVVDARGPCPNWVFPIRTVNEFWQSRATGLG